MNDILNNPPTSRASGRGSSERSAGSTFGSLAALSGSGVDGDLGALGNLDQSQLMQLLSLMNHSGQSSNADSSNLMSAGSGTATFFIFYFHSDLINLKYLNSVVF